MKINSDMNITITCDCGKITKPLFSGDTVLCSCGVEYRHIAIDPIQVSFTIISPRPRPHIPPEYEVLDSPVNHGVAV